MSCLIKLKLKVLVVMFGDGALRVCVATLAVVSLKPIGLCLTWKSWLPCPVRVLVLKWGVVTLLLHKVHFTHTMYGTQSTLKCSHCGGRLAAGCTKAVSRKLKFPCGTSGAAFVPT